MENVIIITKAGTRITLAEWQRIYGLPEGSTRIGKCFYLTESRFQQDMKLYRQLIVNEQLIRFLDALRQATQKPITLNAFNRSADHQRELKEQGYKTATVSPHVVKVEQDGTITAACAADIDTLSEEQTRALVKTIKEVSQITGIKVRIGYEQYLAIGQTFVHVDVCPEYYAPGKPWSHYIHPPAWEVTITW